MDNETRYELHAFCDASEQAYAAVIYLRCTSPGRPASVQIITAKTKVAPLKKVSLPWLELCGALLMSNLLKTVQDAMDLPIDGSWGWTDSTIVLAWLESPSDRWVTFVANRVSQIQERLSSSRWHHVSSKDNPADCASRGISPSELENHPLWWTGPSWLRQDDVDFPNLGKPTTSLEERTNIRVFAAIHVDNWLLTTYSSLMKLQRVTAWCQRFVQNLKYNPSKRNLGQLSTAELAAALHFWVRRVQRETFFDELQSIRAQQNLSSRSRLGCLNPFLDEFDLLRVGGRLHCTLLATDQMHPIILPRKHILTSLIIEYEHKRLLHAGAQLLLTSLQRRFWILCGRDTVRHHIKRCIVCVRQRGETVQQMMGNLPAARVTVDRPFSSTGVDYAGPFLLKVLKGRGQKRFKVYVALFICLRTRAIHLEVTSDLTSESFIATLKRFISRRGRCSDLYSDCGTNFVGANRELKDAIKTTKSAAFNQSVSRYVTMEGINWHFNPPSSPHQGGLWEAGVKSTKYHLRRVIGTAVLDLEEFSMVLTQVEACLNSRPLCPLSSDPMDLAALTPGHFLIGDSLMSIPEPDLTSISMGRLTRWQKVQQLVQHFWRRWTSEYLSRLQQRPKWWSYHPNLKQGDLVLVKDDRLLPMTWPLGRISDVHPGPDGLVRVVTVKTATSEFKRPITKICHLPIEASN